MELINVKGTIEKNTIENQRILKFDIIRTFAILSVILCHVCDDFVFKGMIKTESEYLIILSLFYIFGRLGVPLFLFLSGALLLKKNIDSDEDIIIFYKKNLLPLILANSIWVIIYNVFLVLNGDIEYISIDNIIKELFFLREVKVPNMWYFPMIIGIYLGIPFVAKIVKTFSGKTVRIILIFLLISNFIIPSINIMLEVLGIEESFELLLNLNFFGGVYGVYIILGYYIYNNNNNINIKWTAILGICSFLIAFCEIYLLKNIWYDSISLLICSSCIFILFNTIKDENIGNISKKIYIYVSKISLALFLIHYIIQTAIFEYIRPISMPLYIRFMILYLGTIIFSVIIIKILSKIKFISKYVFRIK